MEDYYKVLGLKRGATLKEISAAYRSQALIYHPDKRKESSDLNTAAADEKFFQIKAAYQALQNPKVRAELDLHLIGQEERLKRDEQMSAQRKQMRDDLLNREREALNPKKRELPTEEPTKSKASPSFQNEDACLLLKCKYPTGIDQSLALEMIKTALNSDGSLLKLHQAKTSVVAEFKDSQAAFKALRKLPNDLIVKADWYIGHPPDNLEIKLETVPISVKPNVKAEENSVSYSKEMEESVLERLKRKKLEKQRESQTEK